MAKRKGEQEYLPGTAPTRNKRVHRLAVRYAELRDARMAANKEEKEAHDTLLYAMIEEGLSAYEYGDITVTIDDKKKCKVAVKGASGSVDGEE